jgi:ADP-heptose:LPS heptosyltransferase
VKRVRYEHVKVSLGDYLRYVPYVSARLRQKTGLKQIEDVVFDVIERARTRPVHFDDVFQFERHDLERAARLPFLRDATRVRVVIHTGSGWEAKLWSTSRWSDLLRRLDRLGRFQFLFVGGSEREERDCAEIRRQLPFAVDSIVRQADLAQVALVMRQSDFFIGVDSGPRHLAHLLHLPSICLLGPGPRMFSPADRGAVYVDASLCRCTTLFCHSRQLCMDRIGVAEVLSAFEGMLRARREPLPFAQEGGR